MQIRSTARDQVPERRVLEREVLERFVLGFEGTSLPRELAELLAGGLAGVAIYGRNYDTPEGLRSLTSDIRQIAGRPVLLGIDQEGGTRFALRRPFTVWPSPAELGRIENARIAENLTERMAQAIGRELRAVGLNVDFAPMLDLAVNPASPVTFDRSFGKDPHQVALLGTAFLRGLASEGVLGCAKHFPGHGDTSVDPHLDLPRFNGTLERLTSQELVPFKAAITNGAALLMTAHILLPRVDPNHPASMSSAMLSVLRRELQFTGVILADDLGMGAITRLYTSGESAVKALEAGSDIAMLCHDWSTVSPAMEAVAQWKSSKRFDASCWRVSGSRIANLREQIAVMERPLPALDTIGCSEHQALAEEIRDRVANTSS